MDLDFEPFKAALAAQWGTMIQVLHAIHSNVCVPIKFIGY